MAFDMGHLSCFKNTCQLLALYVLIIQGEKCTIYSSSLLSLASCIEVELSVTASSIRMQLPQYPSKPVLHVSVITYNRFGLLLAGLFLGFLGCLLGLFPLFLGGSLAVGRYLPQCFGLLQVTQGQSSTA
eukprot:TRINITY_DN11643_c0_g2_i2.p2 TRINITY_DN11643_c0_g2~~TRINITY_DN11643_c0_g2_i2.p2  ORF type:complete len:129 (-),score=7.08 TRINITY_DN11643_c0_g2_i2:1412-1798(-)